jgi:hypothetical protein
LTSAHSVASAVSRRGRRAAPTITRFVLLPDGGERWRCDLTRQWTL